MTHPRPKIKETTVSEDSDHYRECGTADDHYWVASAPTRTGHDGTEPAAEPHDHTITALAERTHPWEPLYGFTKTDPIRLASALEAIRRRICAYGPNAETCDCKYGLGETLTAGAPAQAGGERTGCPELRSAIRLLLHPEDAARAAAPIGESPAAVLAERNQMVAVIGRLMSLPPETIAKAYSVGYTGPTTTASDNLHAPLTGIEVRP